MRRYTLLFLTVLFIAVLSPRVMAQPPYEMRPPGEFEPQSEVLIGWYSLGSYGPQADTMWARAVEAIRDVAVAGVVVRYQSAIAPIQNFLTSLGISLTNVEFCATSTMMSVWVRDYGPEFTYRENGVRVVVEGGYHQEFPQYIADQLGLQHYHAPISMQGGNYMTDGASEVAVSGAYVNNPATWQQTVRQYFDLPLHIVPPLVGEPCGHIDMYARFVAPSKVVISEYANPTHNTNMDLAAAEFEARGFEVFRVSTPPVTSMALPPEAIQDPSLLHLPPGVEPPKGGTRSVYRTYTNGIQCNGKYLVPVYNHEYDAQAVAVFQEALPNHEIVPITCTAIINYGGALHCTSSDIQTTGVPRPDPLTISAVGDDAVLSWFSMVGGASYEVFRRTDPCGFDLHLDDAIGFTTAPNWTDLGGLGALETVCYQVVTIMENGVRSVMSSRVGASRFELELP